MSGDKEERDYPRYELRAVRMRVRARDYRLAPDVALHLPKKSWDESDIGDCFAAMTRADFLKSQRHEWRKDDCWCDIYKPRHDGDRMYIKFTELPNGRTILILSFCEDGEDHH